MSSGLGSSSTFFNTVSYSDYITALHADATTSNDATALAHLPISATNPVNGGTTINVKTANLRAIGIIVCRTAISDRHCRTVVGGRATVGNWPSA
jgi:hypothetical protein